MITALMNQKRGLNRFSKLPDDGDNKVAERRTLSESNPYNTVEGAET